MSNQVEVIMTAKDADIVRAWQKQRTSIAAYEESIRKLNQEQRRGFQAGEAGLGSMITKLGSVAASYVSIRGGVEWWLNANRELLNQANEVGNRFDEQFRKIRVQGGLGALEGEAAKQSILGVALKNAVDDKSAATASQQLVSSGFSVEEGTGSALDVMLKSLNAGNLRAENPQQLTQAFGQFLAAQGLEKNTANLRRVAVGTQRLFEGTDLQVSDLTQLAGKSQAVAGRMAPEEVLATFNSLRQKTDADKASTAFKIFADRLMGASEDKERISTLRQLKLKPADVDLIGESITEVLERIAGGLAQIKPERRSGVLQKLFGAEASSPIEGLIRDRADLPKYIKLQEGGEEAFESAAATGSSGRAAAKRRLDTLKQIKLSERDDEGDLAETALEDELLGRGYSALGIDASKIVQQSLRYAGKSQETSTRFGIAAVETPDWRLGLGPFGLGMMALGVGGESLSEKKERGRAALKASEELEKSSRSANPEAVLERLLEKQIDALEENTRATIENSSAAPARPAARPNVSPPARRPSEKLQEAR